VVAVARAVAIHRLLAQLVVPAVVARVDNRRMPVTRRPQHHHKAIAAAPQTILCLIILRAAGAAHRLLAQTQTLPLVAEMAAQALPLRLAAHP